MNQFYLNYQKKVKKMLNCLTEQYKFYPMDLCNKDLVKNLKF